MQRLRSRNKPCSSTHGTVLSCPAIVLCLEFHSKGLLHMGHSNKHENLIVTQHDDGITTLRMNMPSRLNGWTMEMMEALSFAFKLAASDDATKVVILTGTDPYYSAGVNLGGTIKLMHPRRLRASIIKHNQSLFDTFLDFPKPLLVAVNGPAIGASVTSATLCDGMIASERASFSTPFARLGVPPEGCSSEMFERLLGSKNAQRMLGKEGWQPRGREALDCGLVQWVVPHEKLLQEAHKIAKTWIEEGATRTYRAGFSNQRLKAINAEESIRVADSFLDVPFLRGQYMFLWRKKKRVPAAVFFGLRLLHPLWSRLI